MRRQSSSVVRPIPASSSGVGAGAVGGARKSSSAQTPSPQQQSGSGGTDAASSSVSSPMSAAAQSQSQSLPYRPLEQRLPSNLLTLPLATSDPSTSSSNDPTSQQFVQRRRRRRRKKQKPKFTMNLGLSNLIDQLSDLPTEERLLVGTILCVMVLFAIGSIVGFLYLLTASLPDDGAPSHRGGGHSSHSLLEHGNNVAGVGNMMHRFGGHERGERVRNLVAVIRDKFRRNKKKKSELLSGAGDAGTALDGDGAEKEEVGGGRRHNRRKEHRRGEEDQEKEVVGGAREHFDAADTNTGSDLGGGGGQEDDGEDPRDNAADGDDNTVDNADGDGDDSGDEDGDGNAAPGRRGGEERRRTTEAAPPAEDAAASPHSGNKLLWFLPEGIPRSPFGAAVAVVAPSRAVPNLPVVGRPYDPKTHDFGAWVPPGPDRYPEYKTGDKPPSLYSSVITDDDQIRLRSDVVGRTRLDPIRDAMRHAFGGYKNHGAWGHGGVRAVSGRPYDGDDDVGGGEQQWTGGQSPQLGITIVESLDTLWWMGLLSELAAGREWVVEKLEDNIVGEGTAAAGDEDGQEQQQRRQQGEDISGSSTLRSVMFYDTSAKVLGGLLAAIEVTGDRELLEVAEVLGSRLEVAFGATSAVGVGGESSGVPFRKVDWNATNAGEGGGRGQGDDAAEEKSELGEATAGAPQPASARHFSGDDKTGTATTPLTELGVQLEFESLSRLTGKRDYGIKAHRALDAVRPLQPDGGLFPALIRGAGTEMAALSSSERVGLGREGGSFYATLLRAWLQGGRKDAALRDMYDRAMQGMHDELLRRSTPSGLAYVARRDEGGKLEHVMDQQACSLAATLALGAYTDPAGLDSSRATRDLRTGRAIAYTCYQMYARMATGMAPDSVIFEEGADFVPGTGEHSLLPNTLEALFTLNSLTGEPAYREMGWEIFQSLEKFCKTGVAYGPLRDVQNPTESPRDGKVSSSFFAATMKYMYLLQDPDAGIDLLHTHVFTANGHILEIQGPHTRERKTVGYQ